MEQEIKEYRRDYYQTHKEELKAKRKAYYQTHKEIIKARTKAWIETHKEEVKEYQKEYQKSYRRTHKEYNNARFKAWCQAHKEEVREYYRTYNKVYREADLNSSGKTKHSIRVKSNIYLTKHGTKIPGYQIHHCCTYDEPFKFIYCPKEIHQLIHSYLREHNIDPATDHYEQIKHLLNDKVVLYGLE